MIVGDRWLWRADRRRRHAPSSVCARTRAGLLRTLPCPPGDVAGRFTETLAARRPAQARGRRRRLRLEHLSRLDRKLRDEKRITNILYLY
jgi:hypothetical protein